MLSPTVQRRSAVAGLLLVAACLGGRTAAAQFPQPKLTAIHPLGGQRGATIDVRVVGTDLDDLERLEFFHPGIVSSPVMQEPTEFDPDQAPAPGRFRVRIAETVPPGVYDVVAVGRFGASNPRMFIVGATAGIVKSRPAATPETAIDVPTDTTIDATAEVNAADHYAVPLAEGQRIGVEVWARRLESKLTPVLVVLDPGGMVVARARRHRDEDPGLDFVAATAGRHVIRVHDRYAGGGDEMPYRLTISTGPVVEALFPPAALPGGTVQLAVLGRGLPGGVPATIEGGGLGLEQVTVAARLGGVDAGAGTRKVRRMLTPGDTDADLVEVSGGVLDSMPVPPTVLASRRPVVVEQEPNDDPGKPQRIEAPVTVAGRFHPVGDCDWLSFDAKKGETIVLDLYSRRLGATTDCSLLVQQEVPKGADAPVSLVDVTHMDDGPRFPEPYSGPNFGANPTCDPTLTFKPPADGTYRVLVRELAADSVAGIDRVWALDVRRPEPGFHLVAQLHQGPKETVVLGSPCLAAGGSCFIDVFALRRDGYAGAIRLEAEGLPPGVAAHPGGISPGADRGGIVLTAAADAKPVVGSFRIVGRGQTDAGEVKEVAAVAVASWGGPVAFGGLIFRQSAAIPVAVTPQVAPLTALPAEPKVWEVAPGGSIKVPIVVTRREGAKGAVTLAPAAPQPTDPKVAPLSIDDKATTAEATISVDAKQAAGTYAVLLKGAGKMSYTRNPDGVKRLRAGAERVAGIAKERAAQVDAAKQALAAAEKAAADAKAAGRQSEGEIEQAITKAKESLAAAEAFHAAAETERKKRDEEAKAAEKADAAKDIDVPLAVPSIIVVVKVPPAATP